MKVGHGDLTYFFVCDQGSLVGHCMQDYKCLCTAVTICATLFVPKIDLSILTPLALKRKSPLNVKDRQTHRQTVFVQVIWEAQLAG